MKKCYVHIGLDKTGTSSLQSVLAKSTDMLASRGFIYPKAGQQAYHHFNLARALGFSFGAPLSQAEIQLTLASVMKEATSSGQDVILSTEHFSYLSPGEPIAALKKYLKDYDVKIVVYLRNQISWLPALYCEGIKWSYVDTFENYIKYYFYRLDFNAFVEQWASEFGRENIKVMAYEPGSDTVSSFFQYIMGDDAPSQIEAPRENNSPTPFIMEALRRSNVAGLKHDGRNVFEILQRATGGSYGRNDRAIWPMPPALINELPRLQASNDAIAKNYLAPGSKLFSSTLQESLQLYQDRCDTSASLQDAIESANHLITALVNQPVWLPPGEVTASTATSRYYQIRRLHHHAWQQLVRLTGRELRDSVPQVRTA